VLTASVISSIAVKGSFQASVTAGTIGKMSIGAAAGLEIRTSENIGSVSASSMTDVLLFAGVQPGLMTLPTGLADFANAAATIKSVTLKGKEASFNQSRIAAGQVGKATLGSCATGTSAGLIYGVVGDTVAAATGTTFKTPFKVSKLTDPGVNGFALLDFGVQAL
jgi:hypothetical protein